MAETPEARKARVREWSTDTRPCAVCGYLRVNVVHEPDPANAPEGPEYYAAMADRMHEFMPTARPFTEAGAELEFYVVGILAAFLENDDPRRRRIIDHLRERIVAVENEARR